MHLLHIKTNNNKFLDSNYSVLNNVKLKSKLLHEKAILLKQSKTEKNNFFLFDRLLDQNDAIDTNNFISVRYILGISSYRTNTILFLTDIKGNLIFSITSGAINLVGKQKVKKPSSVLRLIQFFLNRIKFLKNEPISLHLKNFNFSLLKTVVTVLEKNSIIISTIKNYKFRPHNGCRPRKLKRKKRRKVFFKKKK